LVAVWTLVGEIMFNRMMKMLIGSSLPCLLYGCLVCGCSPCDDHQFNWWDQTGEVLMVNKGMVISPLSHLGWSSLHIFFRAKAYVSFHVFLLYTLC